MTVDFRELWQYDSVGSGMQRQEELLSRTDETYYNLELLVAR